MQADLWKKVEELYRAALAQPQEKRAAFLAAACPDDPAVRSEVQSLLDQPADSFLESGPFSEVPALRAGARLGNFEIIGLLGKGGMGEVWRARDPRLKREVAIKVLPALFAADRDRLARFGREARAASALNHPNIVTVYDVGEENGTSFIVSELVEGETLAQMIERGPVPLRRLIEVGTQIAEGLAAAHAAGVVHRDLKPGNVMLTSGGRVKILDFGLARQDRIPGPESTTAHISNPGAILGTPGYMSPEQVRGEPADARSDIFSFGVILHEMACGKPPFRGASSVEIMNSILNDEPAELPPASPPALDRIVRHCLEKQPALRFQSAADLDFALASIATPQGIAVEARRRMWPLLLTAVGVCLAVGIGAWWLGSHSDRPSTQPDMTIRQLTNSGGTFYEPAISPDGKLVAYTSDQADPNNLDIFVQPVDGGSRIRITDDPADDESATFSPDGTQIAFHSAREGGGIYVAPALGGEARLLIPQGKRPRFSPDGQMLMYSTGISFWGDSLYVQRATGVASGSEPVRIGAGCQGVTDNAVWSPDSRHILFTGACGERSDNLWLSTLDGKRTAGPRPLPPFLGLIAQWLPNPSRLLVRGTDVSSIATVPISEDGARITGPLQRITFVTGFGSFPSEASNGRIAFSSGTLDMHIWGIPINGQYRATGPPRRLTSRPADEYEYNLALSRNGEGLVFAVGGGAIHYMNLTTGQDREIYSGDAVVDVFRPDGTTILITVERPDSKPGTVYEIPIRGGGPSKLWDEAGGWALPDDWAPDGSTLLYLPYHPPTETHGKILEKDLKSLATTAFLDDAEYDVWNGHFSHDGRWVTFNGQKDGRSEVFVVPFRKGLVPRSEWIPVTDSQWDDKPGFSYDDKVIFFTSDRDGFRCIWAQRLGPDMHPAGAPFAVYHFHQQRRALTNLDLGFFRMVVGPKMIVFILAEATARIWLLDPAKSNSK